MTVKTMFVREGLSLVAHLADDRQALSLMQVESWCQPMRPSVILFPDAADPEAEDDVAAFMADGFQVFLAVADQPKTPREASLLGDDAAHFIINNMAPLRCDTGLMFICGLGTGAAVAAAYGFAEKCVCAGMILGNARLLPDTVPEKGGITAFVWEDEATTPDVTAGIDVLDAVCAAGKTYGYHRFSAVGEPDVTLWRQEAVEWMKLLTEK